MFIIRKLVNGKHFSVKEKFDLVSRKVLSFYFGRKILSGSCENFKNIILFADYIKFDPQTFNCHIYIYIYYFEYFFQFHPLEFDFYINLDPYFYNCYLLFSYHCLIEFFYLSNLVLIWLLLILFEIVYKMLIIITYFPWTNWFFFIK